MKNVLIIKPPLISELIDLLKKCHVTCPQIICDTISTMENQYLWLVKNPSKSLYTINSKGAELWAEEHGYQYEIGAFCPSGTIAELVHKGFTKEYIEKWLAD